MLDFIKTYLSNKYIKYSDYVKVEQELESKTFQIPKEDINYEETLISFFEDTITQERLEQVFEHNYGSIFNLAFNMYYKDKINKEELLVIINNDKYRNTDISSIYLTKKSLLDLDFFKLIIELDNRKINNIIIKGIKSCLNYCVNHDMKKEFSDFYFYSDKFSKLFYEKLLHSVDDEGFLKEEDKDFFNNLLLRSKLEDKLVERNSKVKVNKI